jgi:hypothetical protein
MDPAVLQRAIPGCERLEALGDNRFKATFRAGVGAVKGVFDGEVKLLDISPEEHYTLATRVKASMGFVDGKGAIRLNDADAGDATDISFSGDVKTGGMLAAVGDRLLSAAAQKQIADLFKNLEREVAQLE